MRHSQTVLVVDDDQRLCQLLAQWIQEAGWQVITAFNGEDALRHADKADVAVVDYMMPHMNGVQLVKQLPQKLPVLMLTAVDDMQNKLQAFESGIDDYLVKPFEPAELLARLKALLRRTTTAVSSRLTWKGYVLDLARGQLYLGDTPVDISSTEMLFLKMLAQTPFEAVSRADLAKRAGHFVSERAVDVQINRLRKKINDADGRILQTVRHIGYALFPEDRS